MSNFEVPITIYLQPNEWPEVTWCVDRIHESDVEYVIASQRDEYRRLLAEALEQLEDPGMYSPIACEQLEGKIRRALEDFK